MRERALLVGGFGSIALAIGLLLFGSASLVFLTFGFLALGAVLLLVGLVRIKRRDGSEPRSAPPAAMNRADRAVWIAFAVLAGLAAAAAVVAAAVAVGEATGHAVGHLAVGLACLVLFGAVAVAWHPRPGSGK